MVMALSAATPPPRLTAWLEWLGLIEEDIVRRLSANQATFREAMRIYDLNPGLAENAYFYRLVG